MRCEAMFGDEMPLVTLTCPSRDDADARVRGIHERGNLPLLIGSDVIAEIDYLDLLESWDTALALPASDLNAMTQLAGRRLSDMLEHTIDGGDLADLVSDAAAFFLFAMRRLGIEAVNRIPPCTVKWSGQMEHEEVHMLAHEFQGHG
jgi:hypothetical protein